MGLAFTGIRRAGLAVGYGERIASRYVCSVMRYAIAFPMPVSRAMTQSPSAEDSPLFVAALASGVSVLRAFSEGRPAMTLPELAEATGLSKSSVQRFTHTLWTLGYLRKDPASKKFSLGPGRWNWA